MRITEKTVVEIVAENLASQLPGFHVLHQDVIEEYRKLNEGKERKKSC